MSYPLIDRKRRNGGAMVIILIILAVLAAGLLGLYLSGFLGHWEVTLSEDGVEIERVSLSERQAEIVHILKEFAAAQEPFRKEYGEYAPFPEILAGQDGVNLSAAMANQSVNCYEGYYFYGVEKQADGFINKRNGYLFAASPCQYGHSGRLTYVIGKTSRVFAKDLKDKTIKNVAEVDGSWKEIN